MKIVWTDEALADIEWIVEQVAEYASPESAYRYLEEFEKIVELASHFPKMGKLGQVKGTRELYPIKGKYRIVYHQPSENILEVITVVMARKLYP
ncbi:hypothetical protein A4G20_07635 [Pasteurellaceae bacterium RH1A]|nr:hypothetical protein A4G20_07635 [Pasteurellaceae bacterium RH1A]